MNKSKVAGRYTIIISLLGIILCIGMFLLGFSAPGIGEITLGGVFGLILFFPLAILGSLILKQKRWAKIATLIIFLLISLFIIFEAYSFIKFTYSDHTQTFIVGNESFTIPDSAVDMDRTLDYSILFIIFSINIFGAFLCYRSLKSK